MDEFYPTKACQYARALAFPRAVGTPGETAARKKITCLLKSMGLQTEQQWFAFYASLETFLKIEIIISQVLILVVFVLQVSGSGMAALPALLLIQLVVLTGPLQRSLQKYALIPAPDRQPYWSRICRAAGRRYSCANVVASFPTANDDPARPHIILSAHLDSKSQRMTLAARIALFSVGIGGSILFAVLILLSFIQPMFGTASIGLVVVVLAASAPLLLLDFGNDSPGAIDNASGVGLLLHLAEVLAARPQLHERVKITLLFSSAEELATMGTRAYVQEHESALKHQAQAGGLYVLNFDGIGVHGGLYIAAPRRWTRAGNQPSLAEIVRQSCSRQGLKLRDFKLPGALFDHIPFADAGFEAVSLIAIGANSRYVHTPADNADKLDPRGFEQAGRAALAVIERLTEDKDNEPSQFRA